MSEDKILREPENLDTHSSYGLVGTVQCPVCYDNVHISESTSNECECGVKWELVVYAEGTPADLSKEDIELLLKDKRPSDRNH